MEASRQESIYVRLVIDDIDGANSCFNGNAEGIDNFYFDVVIENFIAKFEI